MDTLSIQLVLAAESTPKITDWISIVTSLLALGAATWAALTAHMTNLRQSRQLADTQAQITRSQASKIAAWEAYQMHEDGEVSLRLYVMNGSTLPIFNIYLTWSGKPTLMYAVQLPTQDPKMFDEVAVASESLSGDPWEIRMAQIEFTDTEGSQWCRDARGLHLLKRASAADKREGTLFQAATH